jgi:hypothetical protein
MGLRSWFAGLLRADEDAGAAGHDGDGEVELELVVDVDRRAGAIMEHYGLDGEDARRIAEILDAELGREEGYARTMIVDRVARELDMDEDRARTVVDTEVASVRNLARVRKFERQTDGQARFRWVDSVGRDDSPVCADVRSAIDERGPVSRPELEAVIRDAASDHEEGTPARADDLVPHESCRHTVVRHVDG